MRVFKSVLVILCLAVSFSAFAKKEIFLQKKWNESIKSITPQRQVEAWIEDNNRDLSLLFYQNMGLINITVTDSSGKIIYNEETEVTEGKFLNILLEDFTDGIYILSITNNNNLLYGEFSIY